jgi:hypothetical protein
MGFLDGILGGGGGGGKGATQPWVAQYGDWILLSMLDPNFARAFKKAKPGMYKQVFGDEAPKGIEGLNFFDTYDPFAFLESEPFGRPRTDAEQALMDNSLFGLAAPFDLKAAQGFLDEGSAFRQSLNAGPGNAFNQQLGNVLGGLGGPMNFSQMPIPQTPQTPMPPNIGGFGGGGGGGFGGMPTPPSLTAPTLPAFQMPQAPQWSPPAMPQAPEWHPPMIPQAPSLGPGPGREPNPFLPPWLSQP